MVPALQLSLAVLAIASALYLPEEIRLFVPLGCLVLMLIIARVDRKRLERAAARKNFLRSEMDRALSKETTGITDDDFFTIESLVFPKSELLLIDAVHSIFKDLGFQVSAGVNYHAVDRIVRIPGTEKVFGLEILLSEGEVQENHPKLSRAIEFEGEKTGHEKTLIIGSTHVRVPLSERDHVQHMSKRVSDFLIRHHISFLPADRLYDLWHKAKGEELALFQLFDLIYTHPGGVFSVRRT